MGIEKLEAFKELHKIQKSLKDFDEMMELINQYPIQVSQEYHSPPYRLQRIS